MESIAEAAGSYAKVTWNFEEEQLVCQDGFRTGAIWMQQVFQKSLWHDATEEPDPTLNAWVILQSGEDSWEIIKYGGYNKDGGQTWQREAEKGHILRWCYLHQTLLQI